MAFRFLKIILWDLEGLGRSVDGESLREVLMVLLVLMLQVLFEGEGIPRDIGTG